MNLMIAFTLRCLSDNHHPACQDKARELGTSLSIAPSLEEYVGGADLDLGLAGQHQRVNAALAVTLAAAWEAKHAQVRQPSLFASAGGSALARSLKGITVRGSCYTYMLMMVTYYI